MSKNIAIEEGGVSRAFTAGKLKTALQGGGSCLWVPKDAVQLGTKYISENGVYPAAADGKYGYSQVSVSVPGGGSVTGKKDDGNDYTVTVDGQDNIVETKVPSSIAITTPPSVDTYGDGAYIGFDGLVVTAYDGEGNVFDTEEYPGGVIPANELIFPVTVARYDPDAGLYVEEYSSDLLDEAIPTVRIIHVELIGRNIAAPSQPIWDHSFDTYDGYEKMAYYGVVPYPSQGSPYPNGGFFCDVIHGAKNRVNQNDTAYTYNGLTVYALTRGSSGGDDYEWTLSPYPPKSTPPEFGPFTNYVGKIAWTMVYGTMTGTSGGVQIPVQWYRPGDNKLLEDTFGITVIPAGGHGND